MPTAEAKGLSIFWYGKRIEPWGFPVMGHQQKTLSVKALNLILSQNKKGKLKLLKRNFSKEMFDSDSESGKGSSSYYQLSIVLCAPDDNMKKSAKGCLGGGTTGGGTSQYSTKIKNMKIKDKKESWLEKAEVHYIYESWDGSLSSGVYYDKCPPFKYPFCKAKGNLIQKYSHKAVRKGWSHAVNYTINNSSNNHMVLQYAIFEYDKWPAEIRFYPENVNGATINIQYRSYQTAYDEKTVTFTGAYGLPSGSDFSVNNSAIEYNVN